MSARLAPDGETRTCPNCDGEGFIEFDYQYGGDGTTECPECEGAGVVYREEVLEDCQTIPAHPEAAA